MHTGKHATKVNSLNTKSKKEAFEKTTISLLPKLSRIFQKLVYNQLYKYLDENCLLSTNQSGFSALHATATYLLKIMKIGMMQWIMKN